MSIRHYQSIVARDPAFRGTVEASMMLAAYGVLNEDPATHGHAQRRAVAESLFQGQPVETERFLRLFCWFAVFDPAIQAVVYDAANQRVTPERIADADLDRVVRAFWNDAAGVRPETDSDPGEEQATVAGASAPLMAEQAGGG